jgi:hypothetical protein
MPEPDGPQWEKIKYVVNKEQALQWKENTTVEMFAQDIEDTDVAKLLLESGLDEDEGGTP